MVVDRARGVHDPWTVAIDGGPDEPGPIGSGVLVDARRVLTCRHVVAARSAAGAPLMVTFPKAGVPSSVRIAVTGVRGSTDGDVAVLTLAEDAPPEATPARIRTPRPDALVGNRWWAFGFPRDAGGFGGDAHGVVGAALSYGRVRLDTGSRYVVRPGFSGAGLWSRDFNAVVGLISQAQQGGDRAGDAVAVTLWLAAREFPGEKLHDLANWSVAAAGDAALEAWGWSLTDDVEAVRHWRPRARGVSKDTEAGFRFQGRTAALTELVAWLGRPQPDAGVMVVTGSPGVGKSAVLGRLVTTADPGVRAALPADDPYVRAPLGAIACAVHVKGKTALDVAVEIARAASVRLPRTIDDLVPSLRTRLSRDRPGARFNLVVDALDEAAGPGQARLIVSALLLPIARTCYRYGAQVLVGSRPADDGGDLLGVFGPGARRIDLDTAAYFAPEDLEAYAAATLALVGDERAGNPYADDTVARPVAKRIAALADRNFLIAGLVARSHGLYDTVPMDPASLAYTATVDEALAAYLDRLPPVDRVPATDLLTALAYAQAPGLSVDLWRVALHALGIAVGRRALEVFAGSSAANFLVESSTDQGVPRYRLFHQALNDALLRRRDRNDRRRADEQAIARRFLDYGRQLGWTRVDTYLARALPAYAVRAGLIDDLLTDDDFLLHADLPRLTPLAEYATTPAGQSRARVLRLTPQAIAAPPDVRAALFGMTAQLEQMPDTFTAGRAAPYRAVWAAVPPRAERNVLEGHAGAVRGICPVPVSGQPHLATVGDFRAVRMWNPADGRRRQVALSVPGDRFFTVCAVTIGGRTILAIPGRGRIAFVDPLSNEEVGSRPGPEQPVRASCTVGTGAQTRMVFGADDGRISIIGVTDPRMRSFTAHVGPIRSLAAVRRDGREWVLSAGDDRAARLWNPDNGRLGRTVTPHNDAVLAACEVRIGGVGHFVTTTWNEGKVWNPETGLDDVLLQGHARHIRAATTVRVGHRDLVATASSDTDVRVWDPAGGECLRVLSGHTDSVTAICTVTLNGREFLATAGLDRTARLWDLDADDTGHVPTGTAHRVGAACVIRSGSGQRVATSDGHSGVIRVRDPGSGGEVVALRCRRGTLNGMSTVRDGWRDLIAVAIDGQVLQFLDPAPDDGFPVVEEILPQLRTICAHRDEGGQSAIAAVVHQRSFLHLVRPANGRVHQHRTRRSPFLADDHHAHMKRVTVAHHLAGPGLLATAGADGTVMVWNRSARATAVLAGHGGPVHALTSMPARDGVVLVSGGDDQSIRVWDPRGGCLTVLRGHTDAVTTLNPVTVGGRLMLASGSKDRTVRIWDLDTGTGHLTVPVHHPVLVCLEVAELLFVGLTAGSLAVDLQPGSGGLLHLWTG